jgi:PhzF family phenazine biosynthesis protein
MDFPARPAAACDVPPGLLPALGLSSGKVLKARDYLVIVEDAEAVATIRPDFVALARLDIGIGGTIVTAPGDGDIDYVVRFFCPAVGINEDPATGSISCTLGPYWSARLDKQALRARQLSLRGGELECRVLGDRVQIAGQARLYLQGTIEI